MDDRRAALRRRLADLRRQLRRGVDGVTLATISAEGMAAQAELAELVAAERRQPRARKPWRAPKPARIAIKRHKAGAQRGV